MNPTKPKAKTQKSRLQLLHQYYSYTGFYSFVGQAVKKALPLIFLVVVLLFVVNHFFDISATLTHFTDVLPVYGVLSFFFASETFLGLVPPEIFIAWSAKMSQPLLYVTGLAFLSYFGGLLSYWIGQLIVKIPKVRTYLEVKLEKQLKNSKKWGGFLILVGALLPLPFAVACMAAGIIKLPFKTVVQFGSLRLVRFAIYGILIFSAL